ncbi:biotin carboxylase N-terminal domain-containing protein [Noviherbaspirillum sedimenti]|uniref:ATP-grasp domain-containing protein n=1 Tax=Noviherbaspirillum sedimenti TaxID=2320865 RepID=A0A3A3G4R5_9BURK|nr:biotin carboxylase N-terminal domain-containing protein [Noviherbaspirillum sedimenti]RJG02665.1 ATP-grasp domain-containing protein [Noviherbaspirillum sedimenti]
MIKKILIANRGEIACRIARTCRRMGLPVATVHSDADKDSLHVREIGESVAIGAAPAAQSYLNIEAILRAAEKVGANAIHPGIGFLSEDPVFAEAVEAHGLIFIGPRPDILRRFADKWAAKHEARQANVPVIGGSEGSYNNAEKIDRLIRAEMRLPVVLKAAAGGGGRGVRVVRSQEGLLETIESAMREAQSSFGRPDLIVEEFIENARHLEVQIAGDGKGSVIHLFERECSLQRRFQKIIEEAPAVNLSAFLREQIIADAVKLGESVNYRSLGTIEFLVCEDRYYFLECNPRLQVEHTVTEEVTGVDLVELQIAIANAAALPKSQHQISLSGHAIQARVYAEDSAAGFIPSTGRLQYVDFPWGEVRVETGVESGSEITPYYDPMVAKLIAHRGTRAQALDSLLDAVNRTVVFGVETNLGFLAKLLEHPVVRAGTADNRFIDRDLTLIASAHSERDVVAMAALLALSCWNDADSSDNTGLWAGHEDFLGWNYTDGTEHFPGLPAFSLVADDRRIWPVTVGQMTAEGLMLLIDDQTLAVSVRSQSPGRYQFTLQQRVFTVAASVSNDKVHLQGPFGKCAFSVVPSLSLDATAGASNGQVRAPMMGMVSKVIVKPGGVVAENDVLVILESMKMELSIHAPCSGTVSAVVCANGDMVERHQLIVEIEQSN